MSGMLFTRAHKAVRARIYKALEKYELNPTYWSIFGATLNAPEGIRLARVAELLDVKAPMVTVIADELIERGFIARIPHHTDGRAKLLIVTPKGKKIAQKIEAELDQEIQNLLIGASPEELISFQKTLEIIIANSTL